MIRVICACICHIIKDFLSHQPKPLGDREQPNGSESTLGIDVETLPFASAHVKGQLAGHCQGVTDLTLSRSELSKDLGDRTGFNSTTEQGIETLRTRCDGDELTPSRVHLSRCGESHGDKFGSCKTGNSQSL